ncbi:TetR/AcrR family transcriptional regulator [Actinoplanes sp. TBRC 11911]|uniref:TetR/AcrR family transcriptional regulator n=1 Tax=Actinoplanes sp. TBRC 11911 TaxID=2729386 RepID=UPI00145CCE1C|nr:TetR/AcrR family transcriptional regulator [Actinoplanes sp. TBRC 11911]NMO53921.1 TetR/AcrR family transcriptional regulator [Actinoplanes sp. TBRC 11911]
MKAGTRPYRMTARATAAANTAAAVLDATWELFEEKPIADITLADIASRSGVTTQTVLRRFGDKDGVFTAMFDRLASDIAGRRDQAVADALDDVVAALVANYEITGRLTLKMLAEEATAPALHGILTTGREYHREWCTRVFAATLKDLPDADHDRRLAQLIAICDVRTWEVLRIASKLSQPETERALREMLAPLVRPDR